MKIVCLGGGPAGLYFALLMKKSDPRNEVVVFERHRPDDTFGWGVVFSDQTLGHLHAADPESHDRILDAFNHWDDIEIHFKGRTIRSGGHGFCGIGRQRLLDILQQRCRALGVDLRFETEVADLEALPEVADADLVIAADGINSAVRGRYAHVFQPQIETRSCRYIWLGTHKTFDAFTFLFRQTPHGWFQVHAYRFDAETSTFIVETPEPVWRAAGLDRMSSEEGIAFCERLFAPWLDGHALMTNARHLRGSAWINFNRVTNRRWTHGRIVLLGDAAHTAHFSVGSGTKLAFEDGITLHRCLMRSPADLPRALEAYEAERQIEVLRVANAARNSTEWFENVERYTALEAEQFAYSLLTRSQRISHENLRARDPAYVAGVERFVAERSGLPPEPRPPMFTPFTLRGRTVPNRVVLSPMALYSSVDGVVGDFHLVHFGARAHGGAGLLMTEMTAPSADGRITPGCAGLYTETQAAAWQRIVDYVHRESPALIGLQLGHAGPKGATRLAWEGIDEPLAAEVAWPLIAPSALSYGPQNQVPREMTRADMDRVRDDFVRATVRAAAVGFDWLELHCAHGYLLSAFLCPLTNRRTDAYGGTLENRLRFPLEVAAALRSAWPADRPMSVRISAHDWVPGGNTPDDAVEMARAFRSVGVDLIDVSSGQTTRAARPVYGRMYQTPFADRIRNEVGIATMAVGAITEPDHVNGIIAAGRADLCALARPHLADPAWTLHAAAQLGYGAVPWPRPYLSGKDQLERLAKRASGRPDDLPG
jgi:anthraniloyl-CoA monooxygenase